MLISDQRTKEEKLKGILEEVKAKSFVEGYEASDEEALGILISNYFQWTGLPILKTTYWALEDANFHTENETIEELINKLGGKL